MAKALREIVAENIKAERVKQGITQLELARKAKLTDVYVSRIEKKAANITLDSLEQIAGALGVSIHSLLQGLSKQHFPIKDKNAAKAIRHAITLMQAYLQTIDS